MSVTYTKSATVHRDAVTFTIKVTSSLASQIDYTLRNGQRRNRFLVQAWERCSTDKGLGWQSFPTERKALAAIDAYKGGRFGE